MGNLFVYLQYPFVRTAFVVGAMIALCASILGIPLVLKKCSFVGDSLSHTAFLATTVSALLGLSNLGILTLPATIVASFVMLRRKKSGDSFLAIVSVLTLAIGYVAINLSGSSNVSGDVCSVLFGSTSILTLKDSDVALCIGVSIFTVLVSIFTYHRVMRSVFDPNFAKVCGENTLITDLIFAVVIGSVVTVATSFVGALLVTALTILPATAGMNIGRSYKSSIIASCVVSVLCCVLGMAVSVGYGTPVGSTVVITDAVIAIVCFVYRKVILKK